MSIEFLIYQNLTGELGALYYTKQVGDLSGDYVSLADYQELERMIASDTNSQIELGKLRTLLKRWNEISPDLADEYNYANQSPELKQLIQDTRAT